MLVSAASAAAAAAAAAATAAAATALCYGLIPATPARRHGIRRHLPCSAVATAMSKKNNLQTRQRMHAARLESEGACNAASV